VSKDKIKVGDFEYNLEEIEKIPFNFIIGRPRTGTTLIRTMFDAHPNVCAPLELRVIADFYPTFGAIKQWTEKDILSFYKLLCNQYLFKLWKVDKEKLKTDLLKCVGYNSFTTICKVVYLNYISFFKKDKIELIVDKTPYLLKHIDLLIKLFPYAKFILITRDYRDNIISLRNVDFGQNNIYNISLFWRFYLLNAYNTLNRSKKHFIHLKYEDFTSQPKEKLNEIYSFFGVKTYYESLAFYKNKDAFIEHYGEDAINKVHKSLLQPITNKKNYAWKKIMDEKTIKIADYIVGDTAELFGYERKYKSFNFLFKLKVNLILFALKIKKLIIELIIFAWKNIYLQLKKLL
jgi:hypothetical protein